MRKAASPNPSAQSPTSTATLSLLFHDPSVAGETPFDTRAPLFTHTKPVEELQGRSSQQFVSVNLSMLVVSSSGFVLNGGRAIRHLVRLLVHHGRDVCLHHLAVGVDFVEVEQDERSHQDAQQRDGERAERHRVGRLGAKTDQLGADTDKR